MRGVSMYLSFRVLELETVLNYFNRFKKAVKIGIMVKSGKSGKRLNRGIRFNKFTDSTNSTDLTNLLI